ncbi:hypothetical protein [Streptomyces sp. Vc74B-19]|uniref:hypothetical protein n=1 Tax=Streptomyces sp. Vc74B-19 TaxID=2741324 RepID=UPI00203F20AF|nr:hypothetical protein [Streptomyces sp. Vc74B-19]
MSTRAHQAPTPSARTPQAPAPHARPHPAPAPHARPRQAPAPAGFPLDALPPARREELRAACARLAELDDTEFGVRLLANTPGHETRDETLLRQWAREAADFGTELAADAPAGTGPGARRTRVVETTGGAERLLLARYRSRPVPTVELFTDTLSLGEHLVDLLGWRHLYPAGSLRAAALAHERAHCLLHEDTGARRALRGRLGHTALRIGPLRVPGHVAGAGELVAHAYAGAVCGLRRTPLLLTAALMGAVQALRED